jgi:hypothetical protein
MILGPEVRLDAEQVRIPALRLRQIVHEELK